MQPEKAARARRPAHLRAEHRSEGVGSLKPDDEARARVRDWSALDAVCRTARRADGRREELLALRAGIACETFSSAHEVVEFIRRACQAGHGIGVPRAPRGSPRDGAARAHAPALNG